MYTNSLNNINMLFILSNPLVDCLSTHCAYLSLRYFAHIMSSNSLLVIIMIAAIVHVLYVIILSHCSDCTDCII